MRLGQDALAHGDMRKLLWSFCLPSLAANLVTSVYNIVDQIFIGNVLGIVGNAATNVVFPVVTLITALSLMCGVGSSAVMNLLLGRGEAEKARRSVACGFALMVLCGALVSIAMLCWTKPLLYLFGCTDKILPYAAPYARITALGFVFAMVGASGTFLVRADGSPNYALLCSFVGSVLNIFLDALFIYVFHWGIAGAAWATFASQGVSAAMVVHYLLHFRTFKLTSSDFRPDTALAGRICALGTGPMCNFLTQAVVQIFLNSALRAYGVHSVYGSEITLAAAGVANKVNTIVVAVVTGLTNGMQPIVSYNFGRKNYRRVMEAGRLVVETVVAVSFCVFFCYQLFPRQITALFGTGSDLYFEFAAKFFRIFLMLICVNGLQSSVGGFFSAQGKPKYSIFISVTRQIIFLPPLLVVLPYFFGLAGVLWAGPVADFAMAVLALALMAREYRLLAKLSGKQTG